MLGMMCLYCGSLAELSIDITDAEGNTISLRECKDGHRTGVMPKEKKKDIYLSEFKDKFWWK